MGDVRPVRIDSGRAPGGADFEHRQLAAPVNEGDASWVGRGLCGFIVWHKQPRITSSTRIGTMNPAINQISGFCLRLGQLGSRELYGQPSIQILFRPLESE